jgi:hypothetical protein
MSDAERAAGPPSVPVATGATADPEPRGIRGWLIVVAIGQVLGPLRLLLTLAFYYSVKENIDVFRQYPLAGYGELVLHALMVVLVIWTASLFFRESRYFPRFFIVELIAIAAYPIVDAAWVALAFSIQLGAPMSDYFEFESLEVIQTAFAAIVALIWITYILRSRRAKNTFVE